jgi:hypothetical protein
MATVEIQGEDNVRRHLQTVGGLHVYMDANGRVNTFRSKPSQVVMQQAIINRGPQPAPYRAEDIHSTSFPGGNIRSVDMNTALQGMPQWLINPVDATGSQGSVASTATSTLPTAQYMNTAPHDPQGIRLDNAPQNPAMYQYPAHPTATAAESSASGSATTQVKAKKSYAGKRKGDHIDESDSVKKTRMKQPTYR